MKASKITLAVTALFIASGITMTSCRKKDKEVDKDTSGASDNSLAERTSDDVGTMMGIAVDDSGKTYYRTQEELMMLGCGTITYDPANKKVTIAFNGQTCSDGHKIGRAHV